MFWTIVGAILFVLCLPFIIGVAVAIIGRFPRQIISLVGGFVIFCIFCAIDNTTKNPVMREPIAYLIGLPLCVGIMYEITQDISPSYERKLKDQEWQAEQERKKKQNGKGGD